MINDIVLRLLKSFPNSFINHNGEFIAHGKANEFFNLKTCKDELEVKCKVLEYLSRGSCKSVPYKSNKKNSEFQDFMRTGINSFLGTDFSWLGMSAIYTELGNGINRTLTLKLIESNYNLNILMEG